MNCTLYNELGFCNYVGHYGSDADIARAARVSYGNHNEEREPERDAKLLNYLFTHRHTSPFEQANITFNIRMPIFVMRQFVRHRTFKLNEFSARYKELPDEFYVPDLQDWRAKGGSNKQGSVEGDWSVNSREWLTAETFAVCKLCFQHYQKLLARGVASEQARIVLPLNVMTEIVVQCDLHNLMHFLYLRTDSHAQKEIQDLAWAMFRIAKAYFPVTMDLWVSHKPQIVPQPLTV